MTPRPLPSRLPDPFAEIRMTTLHTIRGASYWSDAPLTRMDLAIGKYEQISSADAPGFPEQLVTAIPGLHDHRCSLGVKGGFLTRLRRGTYAAHIVEHVALELQGMIGHRVAFGRTRGTGDVGEYTLVFEHEHDMVGLRAAALALQMVQHAFAGTLHTADAAIAELRAIAETPPTPPLHQHILCGITGGVGRDTTRETLMTLGVANKSDHDTLIVDVSPAYIVHEGLPYSRSDIAIVLDTTFPDIPKWYQDPERAPRLAAAVADAVPSNGWVVCPEAAHDLHHHVRAAGSRGAPFIPSDDPAEHARRAAEAAVDCLAQERQPRTSAA